MTTLAHSYYQHPHPDLHCAGQVLGGRPTPPRRRCLHQPLPLRGAVQVGERLPPAHGSELERASLRRRGSLG